MIRCSLFRFFMVVSPPPRWLLIGLVLVTGSGCLTLWLNPADVDSALGPILFLQMFSASSGFTSAAARGYFDPVLVGPRARGRIALASLVAAATPGLCAWFLVSGCAMLLGSASRAFSAGRIVAVCLVSGVGWAAGVAMPRHGAGAAWSMILVALALSRDTLPDAVLVVRQSPESLSAIVATSGSCLVCPFLLMSEFAGAKSLPVLGLDLLAAIGVVCAATAYICRREYGLLDPA